MKHRVLALLLAAVLLLGVPAQAAPENGTAHFVRSRAYQGQFSDLIPGSVFYDNVAALYEYGLSAGKTDGTFGLQDAVTVGQTVIFAGRIRSLYRTGDPEQGASAYGGDGGPVALGYLRYLQAEGILGAELDEALALPATRAQVAHVLANTLPAEELPPVNDMLVTEGYATRRFITDVTEYTPYYWDILTLYRAGVSAGSDGQGSFQPEAAITRGALAAMLTRLVDPDLRILLDWNLMGDYSAQGMTLASLVPEGSYIAAPATAEEIDETVRHMLSSNSNTMTLQYGAGLTAVRAQQIMEQILASVKSYCEQCYNTVSCDYTWTGLMELTFSAAALGGSVADYRDQAMAAAIQVHDAMWESGQITYNMSEYEKARAYYTWVCDNCQYDYNAQAGSLSHIAYSLFERGIAVCDGYVGAYNMLLKLEGIDCTALANSSHIWTVAVLDGVEVHIDPTWGDGYGPINYNYFAMTPQQSWAYHSW